MHENGYDGYIIYKKGILHMQNWIIKKNRLSKSKSSIQKVTKISVVGWIADADSSLISETISKGIHGFTKIVKIVVWNWMYFYAYEVPTVSLQPIFNRSPIISCIICSQM